MKRKSKIEPVDIAGGLWRIIVGSQKARAELAGIKDVQIKDDNRVIFPPSLYPQVRKIVMQYRTTRKNKDE